MAVYALTGNDTFILSDRILNDFADGSTISITFPNERIGHTTGKNGNNPLSLTQLNLRTGCHLTKNQYMQQLTTAETSC